MTEIEPLEYIMRRFPRIVDQLRQRRAGNDAIEIKDEYDVQYVFRALVALDYDDIRPEEPIPSVAGSWTRVDFFLGEFGIFVETKMTRKGLSQEKLKEQLYTDFHQYPKHPNCKAIVAFVYDPERRVSNTTGFQADMSKQYDGVPAYVFVVQG